MTEHLTDIQLFEYTNELIRDEKEKLAITTHLQSCTACSLKVEQEQAIDTAIKESIRVNKEVDVSDKVLKYFQKPNVKVVGVDVSWVVLALFFISALLLIGELTSFNESIPELSYTTVIASAISALLLVDFFFKYLKYKKKTTS